MFADQRQRTTAIGVWLAALSTGETLGPVVGGVLLDRFWWGAAFLIAVPVMTLLLLIAPAVLPEVRPSSAPRLDLPSAAMSQIAVLLVIGGVKDLARTGPAEPLLHMSLFRSATFSTALGINALGFCVTFGVALFTVQYLHLGLELSPLVAGCGPFPRSPPSSPERSSPHRSRTTHRAATWRSPGSPWQQADSS